MVRLLNVFLAAVLLWAATATCPAAGPVGRLRGRTATAVASVTTTSINVGAKNLQGYGGVPIADSSLTGGAGVGDFAVDATLGLVPAASGSYTYGSLWGRSGSSPYTLSALTHSYQVTVVPNASYVAFPTTGAHAQATGTNELYMLFQLSTAQGGLALGDTVYLRDGHYNPTSALWYFEPRAASLYTGSGRITIRSEHPDATLDVNGNPQLQHGGKMGAIYFNGIYGSPSPYPIDYRDVWFYSDVASPGTNSFFQYAGSDSGVNFYNCRVEWGPDVVSVGDRAGIKLQGDSTIDHCHFKNIGTVNISANTFAVGGSQVISNNIIEASLTDGIDFAGNNISITGNFGFGWQQNPPGCTVGNCDHQDPIQWTGDGRLVGGPGYTIGTYTNVDICATGSAGVKATIIVGTGNGNGTVDGIDITSQGTAFPHNAQYSLCGTPPAGLASGGSPVFGYLSPYGGVTSVIVKKNIFTNDMGGNLQSCVYISDEFSPEYVGGFVGENNICMLANLYGVSLDRPDNPTVRFNTALADPYLTSGHQPVKTYVRIAGRNGSTFSYNFANLVDSATQPGTNTKVGNIDATVIANLDGFRTSAQLLATYQIAFPHMPNTRTDALWRSRAGNLYIFTPADLAAASGGAVNTDGTVAGALFPACSGQANGAWNDGSVFHVSGGYYACNDNTWIAAHPAAA